MDGEKDPPRRSAGALQHRRVQQTWPKDRDFRILSIDGGGIKGIFPATFLAGLEQRYLGGRSVAENFDLIAGTSTGGIIAIGLAAGLTGNDLTEFYLRRGCEIFPPPGDGPIGAAHRHLDDVRQCFQYRYDREGLMAILVETLGEKNLWRGAESALHPLLRRALWRGLYLQNTAPS